MKAKEYVDKISKDNIDIQNRYQTALQLAATPSGVNDEAILVYFQKILDPGSVVREGEFSRTNEGQAALAQAQSYVTKLTSGKRLTPQMRSEVIKTMGTLANASQSSLNERLQSEKSAAKRYNLDEELIFGVPRKEKPADQGIYKEGTVLEQNGKRFVIQNGQPVEMRK